MTCREQTLPADEGRSVGNAGAMGRPCCEAACRAHPECNAITWARDGNACYLKNWNPDENPNPSEGPFDTETFAWSDRSGYDYCYSWQPWVPGLRMQQGGRG